jgi:predicted enzyme related to lactoylglutathione lyase
MQLLVNVDVEDIERGIEFYRAAFALRVERRLFDGSVAEMVGASSKIHLLQKPAGTSPSRDVALVRDYHRHWTPVHLDFEVDDIDTAVERAVEAGAKLEELPRSFGWGRLAMLSDPFGNGFCFVQFSVRGYGAVASDDAGLASAQQETI